MPLNIPQLSSSARAMNDIRNKSGLITAENNIGKLNRTLILPQQNAPVGTVEQLIAANQYPLPDSITIQVASAAGVGAIATVCFVMNQDFLNNVGNNGSGAGSVTYVYQDGFAGAAVSRIISNARAGMGAICYGVSVRMNVTAGGAGDPAGLAAANPFFMTANAFGRQTAILDLNATDGQKRQDFDTSIMNWHCVTNITRLSQFALTMPVADTATITLYFNPNQVPF